MIADFSRASVTILGTAPYTQSHKHDEPKLPGEQPDDHDARTWRSKMNTETVEGQKTVVIPAFGLHLAMGAAARYSKKKIEGQRNATWTAKIERGLSFITSGILNIDPTTVECRAVSVNADGKRGGGTRVTRRFPQILPPWKASFEVLVLDPIITESIFTEMLELAGMFIGVGQYRPENGGMNGRFVIENLAWEDNR